MMREFFKNHYKQIIKILITLLILVVISFGVTFILYALGIFYYDGDLRFNTDLFYKYSNNVFGILGIFIFQMIITTLLCFAPGTTMAFIVLYQVLYINPWQAFFMASIGGILSSFAMYFTGRFGGYKLCKWLVGEKDFEKATLLLNKRGTVYFPLMILFPFFPDDALIMFAGTIKMKLSWFIPSIIIGRGVGVATIVFGLSIIPYEKFTTIWHWIIFILIILLGFILVFYLAHLLNKHIINKNKEESTKPNKSKK